MNRIIIIILYLSVALCSWAVDINPASRLRLRQEQQPRSRAEGDPDPYQPLMLLVADDEVVDTLKKLDVIVYNQRADIVLTSIPRERVAEVLALPGVLNAEISGDMSVFMDKARPFGNVDYVQAQIDNRLEIPYDGSGIIVGFSDTGFDNTHIAFKGRVKALFDYDAAKALVRKATTRSQVSRWITDNAEEWHGTHVANILAGGYKESPYYGVATGADIVAATSRLTDVGILAGVEDIIAYAKDKKKPVVINLSLGNSTGPHDGSSLFCRYLSMCAEDAYICLSAGNTGGSQGYAYKDITDDVTVTRVLVNSLITYNGFDVNGLTDLWSADSEPFDIRVEVFDMDNSEIVYASPWVGIDEIDGLLIDDNDPEWHNFMSGSVEIASGVSSLNGRYNTAVAYNTHTLEPSTKSDGRWSRYYTSIAIKGNACAARPHVDIFADTYTSMIGVATSATSPVFSHDGSISDFCTAKGVIAVGACNSRNTAPSLMSTKELSWNFKVDNVASFSSYSTQYTMPRLPHFAAPGNYVVSAMSDPYLLNHDQRNDHLCAVSYVDGEYYYWSAECGTSMAAPYAAGVIALWLQANPSLTVDQIIEIAQSTALTDYPDIYDPRWGAGCINALAGIQKVLAAMPSAVVDDSAPVRIFNLSGLELSPDVPLSPGIYIEKRPGSPARKILIK